jgi:putative endonuclease
MVALVRWLRGLLRPPRRLHGLRGVGSAAEEAAARALERRGYRVVDRNVRFRFGELDLVCEHRGVLVFVEVKARRARDHGHPLEAITPGKRKQLARLATAYLQRLGRAPPCRFDAVAVDLDARGAAVRVELLQDAFQLQGDLRPREGRDRSGAWRYPVSR